MTTFESRIHLDFNRGFFDSVETDILSAAFERAWAFVESDPGLEGLEVSKRQSELARCLMALEKLGETNPTSLANAAIRMLHQGVIERRAARLAATVEPAVLRVVAVRGCRKTSSFCRTS